MFDFLLIEFLLGGRRAVNPCAHSFETSLLASLTCSAVAACYLMERKRWAHSTHLRFYSTVLRGHIRASSHVLVIAVR
jgi:hypothetical protein